ncbi:uncharacterized protein LOC126578770 [Anopheles aquasalis]|uniref:uncharacterized protein LOC126578770 n=1 Tax=Anopheles aquasalis TaxID=42839 RepID=UPI00215A68CC|nr:uncharacterized protein LOC126578770 [Anopheles aquasalis]
MCDEGASTSKEKRKDSTVVPAEPAEPEATGECYISRLPDEILCTIFDLLNHDQRLDCSEVCRRWLAIVYSPYFQRKSNTKFSHCFGMTINSVDRRRLQRAINCEMSDCGILELFHTDALREVRNELFEDPANPVPSDTTIEDFLFSGDLQLEYIQFCTSFDRARDFIAERLPMLKNLEALSFMLVPPHYGLHVEKTDPEWVIKHEKVTTFSLQTFVTSGPYRLELPSLRFFVHEVDNNWDMRALIETKDRLEELDVKLYFVKYVDTIVTLQFPKLRKFTVWLIREEDSPNPNTPGDDTTTEWFIKGMPELEQLELRGTQMTMKLFRAVCLFGWETLTRLTVFSAKFHRSLFALILELKNLKFLRLESCSIIDGGRLHEVNLPELRHLELIKSQGCLRIDAGLSLIHTFKYSMDEKLAKVCRHMPLIEKFEIDFRAGHPVAVHVSKYFKHIPELAHLRHLTLSGIKTNTRPWNFCEPMPAVKHLVFRQCHIARCDFKRISQLFPELKVLEMDNSIIAYKIEPQGINPHRHFARRLKQHFPKCTLVFTGASTVEPLSTVLEKEDKNYDIKQLMSGECRYMPISQ